MRAVLARIGLTGDSAHIASNYDWILIMRGGHRKPGDQSNTIAVGSRVQTTDSPPKTGVVVEDFGDLAGVQVIIDRDHTAQSRRWAIMLDDGSLVFRDAHSLTVVDR